MALAGEPCGRAGPFSAGDSGAQPRPQAVPAHGEPREAAGIQEWLADVAGLRSKWARLAASLVAAHESRGPADAWPLGGSPSTLARWLLARDSEVEPLSRMVRSVARGLEALVDFGLLEAAPDEVGDGVLTWAGRGRKSKPGSRRA